MKERIAEILPADGLCEKHIPVVRPVNMDGTQWKAFNTCDCQDDLPHNHYNKKQQHGLLATGGFVKPNVGPVIA